MLKMIIADDERIIRETISKLIDWHSMGIELIGLCKDGIEAYDMILDDSPDIVLTDIRMPGLSGIDLIQKISQSGLDTQFILLSGYGEFSYAQEAMKCGVKHYLLKPCNEEQIKTTVMEVMGDCYHKKAFYKKQAAQKNLISNLHDNIITSIINEGVPMNGGYDALFSYYEQYLDFSGTSYELCYIYFLEEDNLTDALKLIQEYKEKFFPGISLHSVYVHNTLLVFFESCQTDYNSLDSYIKNMSFIHKSVDIEYQRENYPNLAALLTVLLDKVRRYGTIYTMSGLHAVPTCNYKTVISEVDGLIDKILHLQQEDLRPENELEYLTEITAGISNPDFLKQLSSTIIIRLSGALSGYSTVDATEFLMELDRQTDIEGIRITLFNQFSRMLSESAMKNSCCSESIQNILNIVENKISDPNLNLKWIAENQLYMNVDYVSKKFSRETGTRFSNYLTDRRIERAKELLAKNGMEQIQQIAEQVGCGNNPQYFSQLFKKKTGMTPSTYAKQINGGK